MTGVAVRRPPPSSALPLLCAVDAVGAPTTHSGYRWYMPTRPWVSRYTRAKPFWINSVAAYTRSKSIMNKRSKCRD